MELLESLLKHPAAAGAVLVLLYCASTAVYRLYLSPIAKFPGPKLAALTLWYEYYYDGIKGGQYTWKIKELHKQYGPIIRISPYELHVSDPSFIDTLYVAGGKKRDKYFFYTGQFGLPEAGFGTIPHDLHRLRRGALNRFFSRASVTKLEPVIQRCVNKLCAQLETYAGTGQPVNLCNAFGCMTTDVVSLYAFGYSYNFLDQRSFEPNLSKAIDGGMRMGATVKQFPWLLPLLHSLPESWTVAMMPEMSQYLDFQRKMKWEIAKVQTAEEQGMGKKVEPGTTIFHEVLRGDLPPEEKKTARLWQEGQAVIGAGTETTMWTLAVILYYLLADPPTLHRLRTALLAALPSPTTTTTTIPPWSQLEQIPYLSATIAEGLRLSYGLATRLARVAHEPMRFRATDGSVDTVIPPGTPVGMTAVLVHHDPTLFPEPERFWPERWLDGEGNRRRDLDGCMLSFSKGGRQCLGMNLAYAEMHIALAAVIGRFGDRLELYETDVDDVRVQRDLFIPKPKVGSKGVRVLVKN